MLATAETPRSFRVAIVGGGLAGLAAAVALSQSGGSVELFEARRRLGGRAASFRDPETDELIDHCQHVSMGCCTNLADFCRRAGVEGVFRRHRVLHFIGPDGRQHDFQASRWLPAPLHLAPSFWRLKYLSLSERWSIARSMWRLARYRPPPEGAEPAIGPWLREQGERAGAIELFWSPVLVSALGETIERAAVSYARQVFVDGFLASRCAYEVQVPLVPLDEIYGSPLAERLRAWGVKVHLSAAVKEIDCQETRATLHTDAAAAQPFDFVICAVPWNRLGDLLSPATRARLPELDGLERIAASPITAVHLWFDRPIMTLPHAVLPGRLSQWIFRRPGGSEGPHYYQVVISGSHGSTPLHDTAHLAERGGTLEQVCAELRAIWPAAREARLVKSRVITAREAVFSVRPGIDAQRLPQRTGMGRLFLAGDWTSTGWPATMEGAVRSGYLAAEGVLAALGRPQKFLAADLPRGWLARRLFRKTARAAETNRPETP